MASPTPRKLGETIQFLESVGMAQDSIDLLMLSAEQHSMSVHFKNLVEDSSQKTFIYKVEIGGLLDECIGYGQSKREAKMNAADDAIEKLTENLKAPKPSVGTPQEPSTSRSSEADASLLLSKNESQSSTSSLIPRSISLSDRSSNVMTHNPIGELQELTMAQGWPTPEYNEIDEYGEPHRKTFICECKLKHNISEGQGSTKKAAKKQAAEEMLKILQPSTSAVPPLFRNLPSAPGVEQRDCSRSSAAATTAHERDSPLSSVALEKMKISSPKTNRRPENFYCGKLHKEASKKKLKVEWYDLGEKGYSGNYQCFVKMSTNPVTVCGGSGPTVAFAHDDAAMNALNCLKD